MKTAKSNNNEKSILITLGGLLGLTLLSGLVLSSSITRADNDSVVDEVSITVPTSCTMSGANTTSHTAEIGNGQSNSAVGTSTITTFCNDNNGFAVYAIGYTDDTLGNNVLTDGSHEIATGTGTSGNSQWAMKLSTITSPTPSFPIIVAGSTDDDDKEQGDPDFSTFQLVPDDYTKVAYRAAGTDTGTNAEGSSFTTTYQVYISPTQPAGTYEGKVKYVMVHPSTAPAPVIPAPGVYTLSRADEGESRTQIGQAIPDDVETFDTPAEAMDAWADTWSVGHLPFYLKHIVNNNEITESYVGFSVSTEIATEYDGVVAGDYALRGGVDESALQNKPVFTANVNLLKTVFDYANHSDRCSGDDNSFTCSLGNIYYEAISDGLVSVTGGGFHCIVYRSEYESEDRTSSCEWQ